MYNYFILVTEFGEESADVLIHSREVRAPQVEQRLKDKGEQYGEVYEVPEDQIQYYNYEPLFLSEETEAGILNQQTA